MTVEVTPARPETRAEREVVVCDLCRQEIGVNVPAKGRCAICERDICGAHQSFDPDDQGDYPDRWCDDCVAAWRDGIEAEMRSLDDEYEAKREALVANWKAKSLGTVA